MKKDLEILNRENLVKVGHVSDGHGLRGDVYVLIASGDVSWIDDLKLLHLLPPGSTDFTKSKTFEIKKTKPFKKGFIAAIHGITDRNQSDCLKKYDVWVPQDLFVSKDGEQPYLQEFIGFSIEDKVLGTVGTVTEFSSNGIQDLLILDQKVQGQNIEIPFVKEFVLEIDYDAKKIFVDLPEGLVSINEKD